MVFATVLTNLLLVSAALAASSSEARLKHRRAAGLRSKTTQHLGAAINNRDDSHGTTKAAWAGAILQDGQNTYTVVSAAFTIPHLTIGGSSSAAAFVSIDRFTCHTGANLQAGVELDVKGNPSVAGYAGFYAWGSESQYFDDTDITFKEGDRVTLTVNATSLSTGIAIINNESTGKVAKHEFPSGPSLCQQDAAWVVEGFDNDLSHFGEIVFSNASATTPNGVIGPTGANLFDIQLGDQDYTSTSFDSSSVTIQRLQTPVESNPTSWTN